MKTVLITAGAAHTGYAMADRFAADGYNVVLTSRNKDKALAAAAALTEAHPGVRIYPLTAEMTDVADICDIVLEADRLLGGIGVFIANAADLGVGVDTFTVDEESYDRIMGTNVKGTFFCCREVAKHMIRHGIRGSMVLMSSVQANGALEGRTLYATSKGAVRTMNQYLAYDLACYGIRVNCIIAGAIHTSRWDNLTPEQKATRRANWPLGIESTGEQIAAAVHYLASDEAATVTGSELTVDSGVSFCLLPYRDRKQNTHPDFIKEKLK